MDEEEDDVRRKGVQRWPSSHLQIKQTETAGRPPLSSNGMLPCRVRVEPTRFLYAPLSIAPDQYVQQSRRMWRIFKKHFVSQTLCSCPAASNSDFLFDFCNAGLLLLAPPGRSQPPDVVLRQNLRTMDPVAPRPEQSVETLIGQKLQLIGDQFYQEHMTVNMLVREPRGAAVVRETPARRTRRHKRPQETHK
ncbi:Argininosuccinate lyase [Labeo rohita]|uniref:Argininosuccinate lyase n=1 Tax=Labeo rohita TaxID=84645 RepID=A0ABQ8LTR7_LABRO|nr:Argininosuccinate lyase [Labeo rohita]